jgi:hypothetical protein
MRHTGFSEKLIATERGVTKANKCYAYFHVAGSFDPGQITERVGVNPTKSFLEGSAIERSQMVRKCSRWELHSRLETTAALEEHVVDVLNQLDEKRNAFRQLCAELGGVMELVGYFHAYYPGLTFERDVIERLAACSLSMDCDFYYLCDEGGESPVPVADAS